MISPIGLDPAGPGDPDGDGPPDVAVVIREVDTLSSRPLSEHAAVFSDAHERLRRALDPAEPA